MLYITDKVVAAGRFADVITMASVVEIFSVVATEFGGARNFRRNGTQLHRRSEGVPKMVAMGKMLFLFMNEDYNSNKNSKDSGCLGSGGGGG